MSARWTPWLLAAALCMTGARAQETAQAAGQDTPPPPVQEAMQEATPAEKPVFAPVQHEELYLRAMRALTEGRADEAAALLNRFLETEPQHAGAWLDLAISQCELGNAQQAEKLFAEIEQRFDPPPGIREVIQSHRAQGCKPTPRPRPKPLLSLTGTRGYDTNVNQGASSDTFATGSGNDLTEWELSDDFLPKSDQFTSASVDYFYPLDNSGTLLYAQARTRRHDSVREQDTDAVTVGIDRPWRVGLWRGRASLTVGAIRLDGALYQKQSQVQVRVSPPVALLLPERLDWSLVSSFSHLSYPTRTSFDSNIAELGTTLTYRSPKAQVLLSTGVQNDHGNAERLGGDRHGWYGNAWLYGRLAEKITGELGWSAQGWRGQRVYSPEIIDIVRRQNTRQLRAAASYAVMPNHSVILEWRTVRNKENISLFAYNSRTVQLSWRWDGF